MFELFNTGGPLIMGLLTLLLFVSIVLAINGRIRFNRNTDIDQFKRNLAQVRSIGILALVIGILGQLMGLFSAFSSIEAMGSVEPSLLAAGLKVSLITTIYGAVIMIVTLGLSLGLETTIKQE